MLTHYGNYPAYEVTFDTGGHLVDPQAQSDMIAGLQSDPTISKWTDLIVISHGWNNNMGEARDLYLRFFAAMDTVAAGGSVPGFAKKKIAVAGIFWPSKRFTDPSLIPGGAAGIADPDVQLNAELDDLKTLFPGPDAEAAIEHARAQLTTLEQSKSAQDDFVHAITSLLPAPRGPADEGLDDARRKLDSALGSEILQQLAAPVFPTLAPLQGGAATLGSAAALDIGGFLSGIGGGVKNAALAMLNVTTYYTMKDRAGIVGQTGLVQLLQAVLPLRTAGKKIHLVGHSFGGRAVTAAANALPAGSAVDTMALLEAAYSHFGLAQNWDNQNHDGAFRSVVSNRKVKDCVLITHSDRDVAVGYAYPLASRIMNQVAAAVWGGASDIYGGMGRNGAQRTPEVFDDMLHAVGSPYAAFPRGKWIRNLSGDGPPGAPTTIMGHGDVAKPEIAYAIMTAM
jgi:hypothetical protein